MIHGDEGNGHGRCSVAAMASCGSLSTPAWIPGLAPRFPDFLSGHRRILELWFDRSCPESLHVQMLLAIGVSGTSASRTLTHRMFFGVLQHDNAATLRAATAAAVLTPCMFMPTHNNYF